MKVIVLGAGIIGVTSAWYLAEQGHEVTVIDRQSAPAMETSFANAGQLSFGYTTPWAAPSIPLKALKWMFKKHAPLIIRPRPDWRMISWLLSMLRNCTTERYKYNKALMIRISDYSERCLQDLREQTAITYNNRALGTVQLFRDPHQVEAAQKDIEVLRQDGINFEMLDAAQCIHYEPGLVGARDQIVGGLRTPDDQTGDCHIFTSKLAQMATQKGVNFIYDTDIKKLHMDKGRISQVETSKGMMQADSYLVAMASFAPFLLEPLGLKLPIYPVKGYSLNATITDEHKAPVSTVIDETYKVAITRLGDHIRVGGMAEISGYKTTLPKERRETLEIALNMLFAGSANSKDASFWCGLRPVTPDSIPALGATKIDNLYTNCGHGTLGWTMACGSGKFIADLISGKKPDIDPEGLSIARYN